MNIKDEAAYRYGIWVAHGKRCFYCDQSLLTWGDFQIDHIIPKKRFNQFYERFRSELEGRFSSLDINLVDQESLHNLILSCSKCNNVRKGMESLSLNFTLLAIHFAIKKEDAVNKERQKFKRKANQGFHQAKNRYFSEQFDNGKTKEITFKPSIQSDKGNSRYSCHYVTEQLFLNSLFPTLNDPFGSGIIEFADSGLTTIWHLRDRDFQNLLSCDNVTELVGTTSTPSVKEGMRFVSFGNISGNYPSILFDDIGSAIFYYLETYRRAKVSMMEEYGFSDTDFVLSGTKVFLKTIQRSTWRKMIDFAQSHDHLEGNTEFHIFHPTPTTTIMIMGHDEKGNDKVSAQISPGKKEQNDSDFLAEDTEVDIFWDIPSNTDLYKLDQHLWSYKELKEWLNDEFIPHLEHQNDKKADMLEKRSFSQRQRVLNYFRRWF